MRICQITISHESQEHVCLIILTEKIGLILLMSYEKRN